MPEPEPEPTPEPTPIPAPLPVASAFDAKMDALDTHAAETLQDPADDAIQTLGLDTAIDMETASDAAAAPATDAEEIADPLELPGAPAALPPAMDLPLELDLDIDSEPASGTGEEARQTPPLTDEPELMLDLEPAPQATPEFASGSGAESEPELMSELAQAAPRDAAADFALPEADGFASTPEPAATQDELLAIETMSDAELEAALAAELAVMERSIGNPDAEPAAERNDAPGAQRREPSFDAPLPVEPALASPLAPAASPMLTALGALDALDDDDDTLVELSSAGKAGAAVGAASSAASTAATASEEPGFIKSDRRRQKYGKAVSIAMALGSVVLVGALTAQGLTTFRNQLAAAMPPLKPALLAACNALGCKIELPSQIDDLNIEQGELQTLSETTFSFNTLLRNQSATAQSWPHIELVLDDASDKAVLRRVFTPRDYLGPDVPLDKGFAPHTEQAVKLYFELNQLKASGYHIAVFYP